MDFFNLISAVSPSDYFIDNGGVFGVISVVLAGVIVFLWVYFTKQVEKNKTEANTREKALADKLNEVQEARVQAAEAAQEKVFANSDEVLRLSKNSNEAIDDLSRAVRQALNQKGGS